MWHIIKQWSQRIEAGVKNMLKIHLATMSQQSLNKFFKRQKAASAEVTKVLNNDIGFTLHVDESTDVAEQKHLMLYTTYVDQKTAEPTTTFLGLVEVLKANARSIARLIKNYLTEAGIPLHKILHSTSDGASVMLGRQNGVAALLRSKYGVDHLTDLHCAAYREALAIKDVLNTFYTRSTDLCFVYKVTSFIHFLLNIVHAIKTKPRSRLEVKTLGALTQ
uniref:DUF4371 domain-containing protein n=1 Tax=Romanomermis culicivorax TaxID=13658 RepID=A0A915J6K2_ROMCU